MKPHHAMRGAVGVYFYLTLHFVAFLYLFRENKENILLSIWEAKMSEFKLRVSIGSANIELEGESELVNKFFGEIRENGLGKLAEFHIAPIQHNESTEITSNQDIANQLQYTDAVVENPSFNYPTLKDIVLSNKIKKETNWILIYTLYATDFGKKAVPKKEISSMYKSTNRYTATRSKNFAANIKKLVTDKLISAINDNDFIITDKGKEEANKLLGI